MLVYFFFLRSNENCGYTVKFSLWIAKNTRFSFPWDDPFSKYKSGKLMGYGGMLLIFINISTTFSLLKKEFKEIRLRSLGFSSAKTNRPIFFIFSKYLGQGLFFEMQSSKHRVMSHFRRQNELEKCQNRLYYSVHYAKMNRPFFFIFSKYLVQHLFCP